MIGNLFDSPWKILIVALVIIVLFGSKKLPSAARSLGQSMRILKKEVQGLREGLGPEFADFEIEDLNPKRFVHKHLSGDLNADQWRGTTSPVRRSAESRPEAGADGHLREL